MRLNKFLGEHGGDIKIFCNFAEINSCVVVWHGANLYFLKTK